MSEETLSVSVVMPVYNAEPFLAQAIEGILNQTFPEFEFIIVDDASTDNSLKIIEEYAEKDKRILLLKNEKNLGIAETRTVGTKIANGKYIAVSDADDISMPIRFERQYNYLETHTDCGVVGGFVELFDSLTGKVLGIRKYCEDDLDLRRRIFLYSPIAQPVCMIRKEVFDNLGYYDPKYPPVEDLDLWFRLGTRYKFSNIQEILLKYRVHANSATISKLDKMETITLELRKKYSHGYGYSMKIVDRFYNLLIQLFRRYLPPKVKLWMFSFMRDE